MRILIWLVPLMLMACHQQVIHQGNVIKEDKLSQISIGDSRFRVETLLGSPAMIDSLHPRTVYYVEQFVDDANDHSFSRHVKISYDKALRVKAMKRVGFKENKGV